MADSPQNIKNVIVVALICFGWFALTSILYAYSSLPSFEFSDSAFIQIVILEIILSAAAITYLRSRRYDLSQLVPILSVKGTLIGLAIFVCASVMSWISGLAFAKIFPGPQAIDSMVARASISFIPLVMASVVNGCYEEIFLVGYVQRSLESYGIVCAIGAGLVIRTVYHLYQGPAAAISVAGYGLVLGVYYFKKKELWPIVFAHIITDFLGFTVSI